MYVICINISLLIYYSNYVYSNNEQLVNNLLIDFKFCRSKFYNNLLVLLSYCKFKCIFVEKLDEEQG